MANRRLNQFMYSFHKKPTLVSAKFKINSAAANGVDSLAAPMSGAFGADNSSNLILGKGISVIYANSSAAATANYCLAGNMAVQFQDSYKALLGFWASLAGPVTGSAILVSTGFTTGTLMQITALGTSTTAQWQQVGVPAGVTPVVGLVFQANSFGAGTGTGAAKALASSNLTSIEVAGDPNSTLAPVQQASGFNGGSGGWLYLNCFKTATLTQPTDGTFVWLNFLLASE